MQLVELDLRLEPQLGDEEVVHAILMERLYGSRKAYWQVVSASRPTSLHDQEHYLDELMDLICRRSARPMLWRASRGAD